MGDSMKRFLLDLIFPTRCPCCNGIIAYNDDFCDKCREKLHKYTGSHTIENCDDAYAVCFYDEAIKPAIFLIKDGIGGNAPYAFALGMNRIISEKKISADIIVPVPMFKPSRSAREYNQCELIARELSKMCGIAWNGRAVAKIRQTPQQKNLGYAERLKNLEGAFSADEKIVKGKRILLIDDVSTTGTTLKEVSSALKSVGADYICALTYCKTDKKL